jgi:hypothetical protein
MGYGYRFQTIQSTFITKSGSGDRQYVHRNMVLQRNIFHKKSRLRMNGQE